MNKIAYKEQVIKRLSYIQILAEEERYEETQIEEKKHTGKENHKQSNGASGGKTGFGNAVASAATRAEAKKQAGAQFGERRRDTKFSCRQAVMFRVHASPAFRTRRGCDEFYAKGCGGETIKMPGEIRIQTS